MKNLNSKIGEMEFDGLITDITPKPIVRAGTILKLGTAATLKRGTIMAKNAAGKLIVLGSDVDDTGTFSGTGDGSTKKFCVIAGGDPTSKLTEVKVDGTAVTAYTYHPLTGEIVFDSAPANAKAIAIKYAVGGGNADCILCDDVDVGTDADVVAEVYFAGCFDLNKCTVASGYSVTEADKDALRVRGILFKAAAAAN